MIKLAQSIRTLAKRWERWRTRMTLLAVTATVAGVGLTGLAAGWWSEKLLQALVPMWRDDWNVLPASVRARAEGQFRLAIVQTAAAIGGVIALLYTARNYRLSRRGQVTDRFTKALERLGSDEIYVRLGGVLALEQIAVDDPEQATNATQVLSAFVRDRTPIPEIMTRRRKVRARALDRWREFNGQLPESPRLVTDVQAALAALTRQEIRQHTDVPIDLHKLDLRHAELDNADLNEARIYMSDLEHASLLRADLAEAVLSYSNFRYAFLALANFTRADLTGADLSISWMAGAILKDANLDDAILNPVNGLNVEQILAARPTSTTKLPAVIASHPAVIARIAQVEREGREWRHNRV